MLGIFSSTDGLSRVSSADLRQVLASLAEQPPREAAQLITQWLGALARSDNLPPAQQLTMLHQIDVAAHTLSRALDQEFFRSVERDDDDVDLWRGAREMYSGLGLAYEVCMNRLQTEEAGTAQFRMSLPRVASRLIRAWRTRLKWDYYRYGPYDHSLWQAVGMAYLAAVEAGLATRETSDSGGTETTTVEREYMHTIAYHTSIPEALAPREIEAADLLVGYFVPNFILTLDPEPSSTHWLDAAQPQPPLRLVRKPQPVATQRYVCAAAASDAADALRQCIAGGAAPPDLKLNPDIPPALVDQILGHFATHWSPQQPLRRNRRHAMHGPLTVTNGLARIHHVLRGAQAPESALTHRWEMADASLGGIGAIAPIAGADWVRVGTLVGLQPDNGAWMLGVVRRFMRGRDARGTIGIETLAMRPTALEVFGYGAPKEALALDAIRNNEEVRMALGRSEFAPGVPLHASFQGRHIRLEPIELVESGIDFDIGRFRVVDFV
ncbi:MAG: hypothetical protein JNJ60_06650 [Rhodocyclaceae bacterium]|nr:hypothetical protein [Rhodocyclaceae bacterium]